MKKTQHSQVEISQMYVTVSVKFELDTSAKLSEMESQVQEAERVRYLTNEQGGAMAKQQMREAKAVFAEAVDMRHIRDQRAQICPSHPQAVPEWLQMGLDGGWIPSREQKGGMEGKIEVIASQSDSVGKRSRHWPTKRRFVATFAAACEVGTPSYAACELKATEARWQVILEME